MLVRSKRNIGKTSSCSSAVGPGSYEVVNATQFAQKVKPNYTPFLTSQGTKKNHNNRKYLKSKGSNCLQVSTIQPQTRLNVNKNLGLEKKKNRPFHETLRDETRKRVANLRIREELILQFKQQRRLEAQRLELEKREEQSANKARYSEKVLLKYLSAGATRQERRSATVPRKPVSLVTIQSTTSRPQFKHESKTVTTTLNSKTTKIQKKCDLQVKKEPSLANAQLELGLLKSPGNTTIPSKLVVSEPMSNFCIDGKTQSQKGSACFLAPARVSVFDTISVKSNPQEQSKLVTPISDTPGTLTELENKQHAAPFISASNPESNIKKQTKVLSKKEAVVAPFGVTAKRCEVACMSAKLVNSVPLQRDSVNHPGPTSYQKDDIQSEHTKRAKAQVKKVLENFRTSPEIVRVKTVSVGFGRGTSALATIAKQRHSQNDTPDCNKEEVLEKRKRTKRLKDYERTWNELMQFPHMDGVEEVKFELPGQHQQVNVAFGSKANRCTMIEKLVEECKDLPGPGFCSTEIDHDMVERYSHHGLSLEQTSRKVRETKKPSNVFVSEEIRFKMNTQPIRSKPATNQVKPKRPLANERQVIESKRCNDINKPRDHLPFASRKSVFEPSTRNATPGPGRYETIQQSSSSERRSSDEVSHRRKAKFSFVKRIEKRKAALNNPILYRRSLRTPAKVGPGVYQVSGTLLKKSFNVTLGVRMDQQPTSTGKLRESASAPAIKL